MSRRSEVERKIDLICNQFEADWSPDTRPDFDGCLQQIEEEFRDGLLFDLLQVDVELRKVSGQQILPAEYENLGQNAMGVVRFLLREDFQSPDAERSTRAGNPKPELRQIDDKSGDSGSPCCGPYKLLRRIGEGGMGTVWIAEQSKPVKRRVALKVIKSGVGSKEVIARFESERQALAIMNHPNIARILDSGTAQDGQPYFAMELVEGPPLTRFCDQNRLGINERLKLFADVCRGVQHAHQKGIIHRDLKPSNILVANVDGKPVPKVIDFGLAKALESTQKLTDKSLFTGLGQILGTLKYMSPEQASLDLVDIDTRTDVYSLGVILYELLTGGTPLDNHSIKGEALLNVLEQIRESEPAKPSRRLKNDLQFSAKIAEERRTDRSSLNRILIGDLDWVVGKALEKDRSRRYESVSGLGEDVQRFLDSEPVVARPPSAVYRINKFVRKNRNAVTAAIVLFVALFAGISGTTWGMFRAVNAEHEANQRFFEAEKARKDERAAKIQAQERLTQIENGNRVLATVFEDIDINEIRADSEPLEAVLAKRLVKAADQLDKDTIGDEVVLASLQNRLGISLFNLGYPEQSLGLFESTARIFSDLLGSDHKSTLACQSSLARAYVALEQFQNARNLFAKIMPVCESILGKEDDLTLVVKAGLADTLRRTGNHDVAVKMYEEIVRVYKQRLGPEHKNTIKRMIELAVCYHHAGETDNWLELTEQAFRLAEDELGKDHPTTVYALAQMGEAYRFDANETKAIEVFDEVYKRRVSRLGSEHPVTIGALNDRASAYLRFDRAEEGMELAKQAYDLAMQKKGVANLDTAATANTLASAYFAKGEFEQAQKLFREVIEMNRLKLGERHQNTLKTINSLAYAILMSGETAKAISMLEPLLKTITNELGESHPETLGVMNNLSFAYQTNGDYEKQVELDQKHFDVVRQKHGNESTQALFRMGVLGQTLWRAKQFERAVAVYENLHSLQINVFGRESFEAKKTLANLGVNLRESSRYKEAIACLEEAVAWAKTDQRLVWAFHELKLTYVVAKENEKFNKMADDLIAEARAWKENNPGTEGEEKLSKVLLHLTADYFAIGDQRRAEELVRETYEIRKKVSATDWSTFFTQSLLGEILFAGHQYVEAEQQLLQAYEGLRKRKREMGPVANTNLEMAIQRIIRLYVVTEQPQKAAEWKAKLKQLLEK